MKRRVGYEFSPRESALVGIRYEIVAEEHLGVANQNFAWKSRKVGLDGSSPLNARRYLRDCVLFKWALC